MLHDIIPECDMASNGAIAVRQILETISSILEVQQVLTIPLSFATFGIQFEGTPMVP